jgi:hypothetical protein
VQLFSVWIQIGDRRCLGLMSYTDICFLFDLGIIL